jgi:hypothetical protein
MTLEELSKRINRSLRFAQGLILLAVLAYALNFALVHGARVSDSTADWGQFGDFLGGLLNPLLAFMAFYWLTQSILLQKEELAATKAALQDSARAQLAQERHVERTARINALSALLASHNNDIAVSRSNMEFMATQIRAQGAIYTPQGAQVSAREVPNVMGGLERELLNSLASRRGVVAELQVLLGAPQGA